jgi:hypothetical protein
MEDAATVKLEGIVPQDYDEEAATAAAMELSKAEEGPSGRGRSWRDVVQLSAMVAKHVANLPPPPPLPPHAPPQATWDGQMVPPPHYMPPPQYTPQQPPEVHAWAQ